ncbi:DNA polymerase III subunit beta family protein [Streptomyces zingiberis]|uniref:MerR family transcriptional regulator n=1 Tax=Streptomyces zingiberis TaxID=2053010 RepID=A0ABX1C3D8_9ACTN|nr:MerR family transcriptional regulator [Streptomyces zingiberis]NJQ03133.1 MerR family transcriptional regulator [Streptomyces zingiberis]
MPNSELMPIGVFAQRSGLTSSALRFYADSGLLPPADVDPATGYRYYAAAQVERATTLRRLREIAMPLATVEAVLATEANEAVRLLDEHVAKIEEDAAAARRKAAAIKSALVGNVPGLLIATLKGPVLADAVEQVLTATAYEPAMAVLAGLRIEVSDKAIALTATDRYRLSTRTLVPARPAGLTWAGTVDSDDLRAALADVRRSALIRIEAVPHGIWLRMPEREGLHCRTLSEEFPDHRLMLASLNEATTRATVSKNLLLRVLEEHPGEHVVLHITDHGLSVRPPNDEHPRIPLSTTVTGRTLQVQFEMTTLYPAVSTAIGPDVMLDLRGHDQPVTIRSADCGDLTTLAMPIKSDHSA